MISIFVFFSMMVAAATNTGAFAAATTAAAGVRRRFGPSERKVNSIKEWARENLMVIKTQCEKLKESASEGIRMIAEDLPEIEKEKDRVSSEK